MGMSQKLCFLEMATLPWWVTKLGRGGAPTGTSKRGFLIVKNFDSSDKAQFLVIFEEFMICNIFGLNSKHFHYFRI